MKTYQKIAQISQAVENCIKSGNQEWQDKHEETLKEIMDTAPSGSGFDSGTQLAVATDKRIVFDTAFHHMNAAGYYDGWTEHRVIIRPAFIGFEMRVTGRDKRMIKEYIGDVFRDWLNEEYNEYSD